MAIEVSMRSGSAPGDPDPETAAAVRRVKRKRTRLGSGGSRSARPKATFSSVSVAPHRPLAVKATGPARRWHCAIEYPGRRWRRVANPIPLATESGIDQKVVVHRYTDDEYNRLLMSSDWSRDQTDLLLDLVEKFDRRFVVVADRFQTTKSVEQIKDRFYQIQSALISDRHIDPEHDPLLQDPYDMKKELHRKAQLGLLFARTTSEERDVAGLVLEHRRLEQAITRRRTEQKDSRRLHKVQEVVTAMTDSMIEGSVKRRSTKPPSEEEQALNPLGGLPDHVVVSTAFPVPSPGVYLRHEQLKGQPQGVNQRLQKQLEVELEEAGLTTRTIPTPTGVVAKMFDRLRQDYLTLFNLQRYVVRKEQDTQQLRRDLLAAQKAAGSKGRKSLPSTPSRPKAAKAPVSMTPQRQAEQELGRGGGG